MAFVGAKCNCEVAMSKNQIFTLEGPQPFELGPAFDDVKSGAVHIPKTWKPDRSMVPEFLNDCCVGVDAMDFETGERWSDSIVVLVVWFVITLPFLALFFWYRKYQPLRFRSFSTVLLHYLIMSAIVIWAALRNAYDRTFSCWVELAIHHIAIPIFIFYYVMKAAQLIFVFEWTTAKANNTMDRVNMFYKYRYFLRNTAYFGCMGVLALFGVIWLIVEATHPDLNSLREYPTLQGTMRCEWWQIPESYRPPTRESSFCSCLSYDINSMNENSDPGDDGPLDPFACFSGYVATCRGADPENNKEIVDSAGRTVCDACPVLPPDNTACTQWFQEMLFQGTCGWFDETPHMSSCVACLGSNKSNLTATLTLLLLELATFLLLWLYARRYNDQLFIRTEGMLCLVVLTPVLCVGLWMLYDDQFRKDTATELDTKFDIYAVFMTIAMFWACFVSIILPVIIQLYYRYQGQARKEEYKARKRAKKEARARLKSGSKRSQSKPSDSSFPESSVSNFVTGDDTKMFEFAIRDIAARELLRQFCIQEFSVENLDFLVTFNRVSDFIQDNDLSDPHISDQAHQIVQTMYNIHIKMGAPVEVNLSHTTRNRAIAEYLEVFGPDGANERVAKDNLVKWLRPAYNEIRELILSDSWYRFQQSEHYPKLKQQYTTDVALGKSAHRAMFSKHEASVTTDKIAVVSRVSENRSTRMSRGDSSINDATPAMLRSTSSRREDDTVDEGVELSSYASTPRFGSGAMANEVLGFEPAVAPVSPRDTIVPEESDRPSSWFFRPKVLTPKTKSPRGPGGRSPRQRSESSTNSN